MQCNRCGVYFSRLDVVIGNCIPQGYGYRHTYREDCGDDVLPKSRSIRTVRELFVAPAPPAPIHRAIRTNRPDVVQTSIDAVLSLPV